MTPIPTRSAWYVRLIRLCHWRVLRMHFNLWRTFRKPPPF